MKKCTELLKNGNSSLIEIRETDTDKIEKYVICQNFNNSKEYGNKWDNGRYYDVYNDNAETQMKRAAMALYNINESDISFERLTDLAKAFLVQLRDYVDNDDEFADVLKNEDITEDEADFFGIKDVVFPRKFKLVTVTMRREQRVDIKVIMPDDEDTYNVDSYIDGTENIEDAYEYQIDTDDWEVDDWDVEEDEMTMDEVKRLDEDEIWNACDIDNM